MAEVRRHPILTREEESALAVSYAEGGDVRAAHRLVVANLRFVVKIAHEYGRYGLRLLDLVQEGNVGLMVAVKRFDPRRGYRLISYAVWWIRAYIQGFVMRSWSLVRLGATGVHRKLFFRLKALRAQARRHGRGDQADDDGALAQSLGISEEAIVDMSQRLAARDFSLDARMGEDGDGVSYLDRLADDHPDQEQRLADRQDQRQQHQAVHSALAELSDKERHIIEQRMLADDPPTLQEIGEQFSISRERVRQIEARAVAKLRARLTTTATRAAAS